MNISIFKYVEKDAEDNVLKIFNLFVVMIYVFPRKSENGYFSQSLRKRETIIDSSKKLLT